MVDKALEDSAFAKVPITEPDLHEYKRMVQEKESFQRILENKVKELDRTNRELEEFAYIASHDLQEPLRKITSFSERLREKLPSNLEPEVLFYLNRMIAATENMRTLIDNLLEFSRTSRISEPFVTVDLNQTIASVLSDLELKIDETGAVIDTDRLPVLEGIPMQLRQMFTNLLTNAFKFRKKDHKPHITISCRQLTDVEKDEYSLQPQRRWYRMSVQDEGIGFEQEFSEKIFKIFQRLHGKAEYPGSGIGLAICKKIVENHRGIIFARSQPGQGAEFVIIVPENQS